MSAMTTEEPTLSAAWVDNLAARLERLERNLERMDRLFARLDTDGPNAVATVMDIADELAAGVQARDVDIDPARRRRSCGWPSIPCAARGCAIASR